MPLAKDDALLWSRCVYAGLIVLCFPLKTPHDLSALGSNHFHPPFGPFALFDSYPPSWFVLTLESAAFVLLAFWVAGRGKWIVGAGLTLVLIALSGFVYSAGKVDHDLAILLFPLLVTLPLRSPEKAIFFCLGVYYASSALAKAAGGWLDPSTQASLSWALLYQHTYQSTAPLLGCSLTTLPGWAWELFDYGTVLFELAIPLALLPRFRRLFFLTIPVFHFGILLLFGIDFARLLLLYIPLAILCLGYIGPEREQVRSSRNTLWISLCCAALAASLLLRLFTGHYWTLPLPVHPPGYLLFPLFEAAIVTVLILQRRQGRK